nr:MAG TPA: hypothetical protein [Caudoviricetes sp.]
MFLLVFYSLSPVILFRRLGLVDFPPKPSFFFFLTYTPEFLQGYRNYKLI